MKKDIKSVSLSDWCPRPLWISWAISVASLIWSFKDYSFKFAYSDGIIMKLLPIFFVYVSLGNTREPMPRRMHYLDIWANGFTWLHHSDLWKAQFTHNRFRTRVAILAGCTNTKMLQKIVQMSSYVCRLWLIVKEMWKKQRNWYAPTAN